MAPGTDLELVARQELARHTVGLIADILEIDANVAQLLSVAHVETLTQDPDSEIVRIKAERALRCITSVAKEDSVVLREVGEQGLYSYVEAVIQYGAADRTYLALIRADDLTPDEATSFYALRELIADETDGTLPGFPTLHKALKALGISPRQAIYDPDGTVAAMHDAGFFVDHLGGVTYDRPIFYYQGPSRKIPLGPDIDTVDSTEDDAWLRALIERGRFKEPED
jgi:hypothetical protein